MEGPPANDCCSICHGNFHIPCQANCSHWFCGNCILEVWNHGSTLQPCKCPLCRREITLLIPSYALSQQHHDPNAAEVIENLERYNRYFGARSNGLIQMLVTVIYIISPVDIIPEGILGIIGLLDDALIALLSFLHVAALYRSVLLFRHGGS